MILVLSLALSCCKAALYPGNKDTSHGGEVGNGQLTLKDNGVTVSGTFTRALTAPFDGDLVLFIDCVPGGFTSTASFTDNSTELARAITGLNEFGTKRNIANFVPGFTADYAIAMGINPGIGIIYHLAETPSGPALEWVGSANLFPFDSTISATYAFSFDWTQIGLPAARTNFFKFESTYSSNFGTRSKESFESESGSGDWGGTLNFSNYDVYGVNPVPETANAALVMFAGLLILGRSAHWLRIQLKQRSAK
jgi:hypothetical protein